MSKPRAHRHDTGLTSKHDKTQLATNEDPSAHAESGSLRPLRTATQTTVHTARLDQRQEAAPDQYLERSHPKRQRVDQLNPINRSTMAHMATQADPAHLPTKRSPRRNGEKRRLARPAGAEQPLVNTKIASIAAAKALAEMPGAQLSDAAVTLVTLRVNSKNVGAGNSSPTQDEPIPRILRPRLTLGAGADGKTSAQYAGLCGDHWTAHTRGLVQPQGRIHTHGSSQDLMERAALGLTQRSTPTSQASSFAFAFHSKDEAAK